MMITTESEIKPQFGEVYKCAFYVETVGSEVKGYRPVLVISAKWYNEESERITILPLTRAFNRQGTTEICLCLGSSSKNK